MASVTGVSSCGTSWLTNRDDRRRNRSPACSARRASEMSAASPIGTPASAIRVRSPGTAPFDSSRYATRFT